MVEVNFITDILNIPLETIFLNNFLCTSMLFILFGEMLLMFVMCSEQCFDLLTVFRCTVNLSASKKVTHVCVSGLAIRNYSVIARGVAFII